MENLWVIIAKERGVSLDEEFIYGINGVKDSKCKITREKGLETYNERLNSWVDDCRYIDQFIKGEGEITKLPFEPKLNETYWSYNSCIRADDWIWLDSSFDYRNKMLGLVFRTKEEAENYLPTFKERLKEQGWLEK